MGSIVGFSLEFFLRLLIAARAVASFGIPSLILVSGAFVVSRGNGPPKSSPTTECL